MRLLGLGTLVALALQVAQPPVFKTGIDVVRVDVRVTDGKRPVPGLTAADFELKDRGVPQRIETVSLGDVPLSVVLLLDTSASVQGRALADLKKAATAVIDSLEPGDRAAVMTFSGSFATECEWSGDRRLLRDAISRVEASGATALHDAAYAALTLRDATPNRALVIAFSDGADTASWLPGERVVELAKRADAVFYAVTTDASHGTRPGFRVDFSSGIQAPVPKVSGSVLLESFLDALAHETGGEVLRANGSEPLRDVFVSVMQDFRERYLLTYTPTGVDGTGWHPITVELKGRAGSVLARRGYTR